MRKEKIFDLQQAMVGSSRVCTCCGRVVETDSKTVIIDDHELHINCGEELSLITAIKKDLRRVISELHNDLFRGTNVLERLEKTRTANGFKFALAAFWKHIEKKKSLLADKFDQTRNMIWEAVRRSVLWHVLAPAMNF